MYGNVVFANPDVVVVNILVELVSPVVFVNPEVAVVNVPEVFVTTVIFKKSKEVCNLF